jgi:hypothetical protein
VVITKSTVPLGTGDHAERIMKEINPTADVVMANPEFLREGAAIRDFKLPDPIISELPECLWIGPRSGRSARFVPSNDRHECPRFCMRNRSDNYGLTPEHPHCPQSPLQSLVGFCHMAYDGQAR